MKKRLVFLLITMLMMSTSIQVFSSTKRAELDAVPDDKSFACEMQGKKTVNPIVSVTIGKQKLGSKKFAAKSRIKIKCKNYANKKIKIKLKPGWILDSKGYFYEGIGWDYGYWFKNGTKIDLNIKKESGSFIDFKAIQKTTGQKKYYRIIFEL